VVGASLFQPVKNHMKPVNDVPTEKKSLLDPILTPDASDAEESDDSVLLKNKNCKNCVDCVEAGKNNDKLNIKNCEKKHIEEENERDDAPLISVQRTCWKKFISLMDLDLLKDLTFLNIVFGVALAYTESAGLNRADTAMCMSVLAGADIVSRLTLPTITQILGFSCRLSYLIGAAALILARALLAEQKSYTGLIAISALCGYVRAATVVNQNLVLSEHCKASRLPAALGLGMCVKGAFVITIGQFLGWLRDYTGSYSLCIHAQNILLILIVITWVPELLYKYCKRKSDKLPLR
ncbi:uncharacterized protein LOC113381602, partial [Ctenocephalides felis]|uniref:uncharacterized protein LOC113381602 n=1 Tax=Ctenocephalides felis TaxID=7515 RepID=UPI000E6E5545